MCTEPLDGFFFICFYFDVQLMQNIQAAVLHVNKFSRYDEALLLI